MHEDALEPDRHPGDIREAFGHLGQLPAQHPPAHHGHKEAPIEHEGPHDGVLRRCRAAQLGAQPLPPQVQYDYREGAHAAENEDAVAQVLGLYHESRAGNGRGLLGIPRDPLVGATGNLPIDGRDAPWGTKAEEHVHGVAPCDVHHGGVGDLVFPGGRQGGEEVGHRGAQGHEGDRGDDVRHADDAAQQLGEVRHHGGHDADGNEGGVESDPAAIEARRGQNR
mmetsp:Transcript_130510/g.365138  ORF Transcript_130510/g.365138 Transcript_130510/m.365138 type:complete len:223 (+) Transcript_130510:616-1284(+)